MGRLQAELRELLVGRVENGVAEHLFARAAFLHVLDAHGAVLIGQAHADAARHPVGVGLVGVAIGIIDSFQVPHVLQADGLVVAEEELDTLASQAQEPHRRFGGSATRIDHMGSIRLGLREQAGEALAVVARAIIELRADVLHGGFNHTRGMVFEQATTVACAINNLRIHSDLVIEDVGLEGARFIAGLAACDALVGIAEAHGGQAGTHGEFHRGAENGVSGDHGEFRSQFDGFLNERVADASVELGDVEKSGDHKDEGEFEVLKKGIRLW